MAETPSWISSLSDPVIKADMAAAAAGGAVSQTAMAKLFSDLTAELITDDAALSTSQFNDLKTIAADLNVGETVSPYVAYITDALIEGNTANAKWTGGAASTTNLGNLAVGSTATQLAELNDKWFLGTDLPSSVVHMSGAPTFSVSYSAVTSPIFGPSGPSINDINQGYLGDCYLMASLAEVACQEPSLIGSMITNNGNNTYGVRFFVDGTAEYVTVNDTLSDGGAIFNSAPDIWASLIEKAYAQIQASGVITGNTVSYGNSFSTIGNGGDPEFALEEITGASTITDFDASGSSWSEYVYNQNFVTQSTNFGLTTASVLAILVGDLAEGGDLVLSSETNATANGMDTLVADHAMSIYGYDTSTGDLEIRNPWGTESGQYWDTTFEVSLTTLLADGDTVSADDITSSSGTTVSNGQTSAVTAESPSTGWIVLSGGTLSVSAGGVTSGAIDSGGNNVVLSGGTALGTLVSGGGVENVSAGGAVSGTTVGSGSYLINAGIASGSVVKSGGRDYVVSGGIESGATISAGGNEVVYGTANGTVVNGLFGIETVNTGASASGTTIGSGAYLINGGTASGVIVANGGNDYVTSGGSELAVTVSSGALDYVETGAIESGATVSSAGLDFVQAGATATGVTIFGGGSQGVHGTTVSTVLSGLNAIESAAAGGVASDTTVGSGAYLIVAGTASGATISAGGTEVVYGTANGTVVTGTNAIESAAAGGVVSGATIGSGGYLINAGTASGVAVGNGGFDYLASGGSEAGVTVSSGALDYVEAGGIESGATVSGGGFDFVAIGGSATGVTISAGGSQLVHGTADGTVLSGTNAIQSAVAGGVVSGTTIGNGAFLLNGGTASGVMVANGGGDYVLNGATDVGATVFGGGLIYAESGGALSGVTISSGTVDLVSGATFSGTATFVNSGLLELGSSQAFSGLVAGFSGTSVFMDLQDIAYVSGGGTATTLTWNQITSGSTGSGTLIVSQGGHAADITLLGNYMQTNFAMSSATAGGTLVTDPPVTQTASAMTLANAQHG